ncbi:MAG: TonB-dependent receptor domain-containing protein [bacterium]
MLKQTFIIVTLMFAVLPSSQGAAQTGQLRGYVFDLYSGEPLPNANVVIIGTSMGVAADNHGYFALRNIPAGKYYIRVSRIGYQAYEHELQIEVGQTIHVNFPLQAEAVRFGEVLVTATREKALRSEVAVATEIITRPEIERASSQNVGEVLEYATGLFVKNYGHIGALKTASIRGASENQVLVLLDGQRLNLAQGIAPDLGDIPLHAIERIEIIRGGHSALYGTDAVGGVINLITRSSSGKKAVTGRLTSTLASFGTKVFEADFGQKLGAFNYFISHNYTESDGDFQFQDSSGQTVNRTNNNLQWNDTFLKLSYSLNPSASLSGYVQIHDAERGVPGPLSFLSETAIQKDKTRKYNLRFEQYFDSKLNFQAQTFFYKFKQKFDDPSAFFPIQSEHKNDVYGLSFQANWRVSNLNQITGGYEFRQDKINSSDVASHKRTIHSVFLQDQIQLPLQNIWSNAQISVVPALRLDKYTDVEAQISPKMGFLLRYITNFQMVLRSSWGRSYRVPSFNDLYWPAGSFTAGNPHLVPEKGIGFDVGFGLNFKKAGYWGLELNYFKTTLDNLIIWGPGEDAVWSPKNVQEANITGVETRLSFQALSDLIKFEANYNYLDAVDNSDNETTRNHQLIYRPKHKVDLTLNLRFKQFQLNGAYRMVAKRFTTTDNTRSLEAYTISDLGASWKQPLVGGALKIQIDVRNVFDKKIQIIEGYPNSGREYRTTFGIEF